MAPSPRLMMAEIGNDAPIWASVGPQRGADRWTAGLRARRCSAHWL